MAASTVRATGTRIRYDGDDLLWHARVRVARVTAASEEFLEFATKVATLVELLAWIADIFSSMASTPGTTVMGHDGGTVSVTSE